MDESLWRRGWQDTKSGWKSWQFVLLDAVVCVLLGSVFEWYWGLGLFLFGMSCVWIGATIRAPIVQRNELRASLRAIPGATPDAPKLAHAQLELIYCEYEFGEANGTPIVSIEVQFASSSINPMRIEAVVLCLAGKQIPSLNWEVQEVSHSIWITENVQFNISEISLGEHDAKLIAFSNEIWWRSHPFTITFPEVNS